EAESAGTLAAILVPEGGTAAVGEPIATLGNGDGAAPVERPAGDGRPNATPVARRKAVELGVSLHGLTGTGPGGGDPPGGRGPGGRITQEDVERAAAVPGERGSEPPAEAGGKGDVETVELTATQATIARRMVESATTIPSFSVSADVDMTLIGELRRGAREERDDAPSLNDFVVKAAAQTLRDLPRFHASYVDGNVDH